MFSDKPGKTWVAWARWLRPVDLFGPIFDKELRVSSRRKRNYLLRFGYLAGLTALTALVWAGAVDARGGLLAVQQARLAEAGKLIIVGIVVFQFLATQFIALVMLSTSISDEIYHRTLAVLMTTPITSLQIVMGKLLSKLLQLLVLIAISLPLLATIRVLGGVSWGYIGSSLCITLTTIVFVGSLSLLFSISGRKSYAVILTTSLALAVLYAFVPGMIFWFLYYTRLQGLLLPAITLFNPIAAMAVNTQAMLQPGGLGGLPVAWLWKLHCLLMLVVSGWILAWAVAVVRCVASEHAAGSHVEGWGLLFGLRNARRRRTSTASDDTIREVVGSPVVWKELRAPFIQGGRRENLLGLVFSVGALAFTYWMGYRDDLLREDNTHMSYVTIFVSMALLAHLVLAATMFTTEKERRSWPLLLSTTLTNGQIVWGKALGVVRRCLPLWAFLAAHVMLYVLVGYIHPVAVVHVTLIAVWIAVFLTGTGLYFSVLFRRTTAAVVANMALAIALWFVIPVVLGSLIETAGRAGPFQTYMRAHPLVQTTTIMRGNGGELNAMAALNQLRYIWPDRHATGLAATTGLLTLHTAIYCAAGVFFAWRAARRLRKHVF